MIRLGYVGINTTLPSPNKTFRLSNYSDERMLSTAEENLTNLKNILIWNKEQKIFLFRLTSQIIPLGSHPINSGVWKEVLKDEFIEIGTFIKENNMKVSFHPGQYTVLNSPNETYYQNALRDLSYHASIFDLMGLDYAHRMVIHGGGGYGDKLNSLRVLRERIKKLPEEIYQRFMLENDDVIFNADEILHVCLDTQIRGVLDTFHHEVLGSFPQKSIRDVILLYKNSWKKDERQKIQYSNQDPNKLKGAHSKNIDINQFGKFYDQVSDLELDIMLEVKDKEQSVMALRKAFPLLQ